MSLGAMDKVADLERARDEAAQRAESLQRAAQRASREWELERGALDAEVNCPITV